MQKITREKPKSLLGKPSTAGLTCKSRNDTPVSKICWSCTELRSKLHNIIIDEVTNDLTYKEILHDILNWKKYGIIKFKCQIKNI